MKTYEGVDIWILVCLTSAILEVSGHIHAPAAFPGEEWGAG
jgi:hypothetical protein